MILHKKRNVAHRYFRLQFGPIIRFQHIAVNSSPPGQNGRHFTDDNFRCVFVNEKFYIFNKIALKFVLRGPIDNNPALAEIMAWRRIGDKPLSQPMLTRFTDAYIRHALGGVS